MNAAVVRKVDFHSSRLDSLEIRQASVGSLGCCAAGVHERLRVKRYFVSNQESKIKKVSQ